MSNAVAIRLSSNAEEIVAGLDAFPGAMAQAIAAALDTRNQVVVGHIVATKLTSAGPRFLNRRTSTLARSIRATRARVAGRDIASAIGTNVRYAGVHEFGFKGSVNVPAFTRKNRGSDGFSVRGAALTRRLAESIGAFGKSGRARAGVTQTSSSVSFVRSHTRRVNFPARAMIFTGISEKIADYSADISKAIEETWNK